MIERIEGCRLAASANAYLLARTVSSQPLKQCVDRALMRMLSSLLNGRRCWLLAVVVITASSSLYCSAEEEGKDNEVVITDRNVMRAVVEVFDHSSLPRHA